MPIQETLFSQKSSTPKFDGATFDQEKDGERLTSQLAKVKHYMSDELWHTVPEIKKAIKGGSESGISARIRDLRKSKFGGYRVDSQRVEGGNGLYEYRLILNR